MSDVTSEVAARIRSVLEPPSRDLVAAYYDPEGPFAAHTFEALGENARDAFAADDLLALTLLDLALSPRAVRAVFGPLGSEIAGHLRAVTDARELWEASDEDLDDATKVYGALDALPGVGPVKAGKLLARKRPALIPVIDKHVIATLQAPKGAYWRTMRGALAREELWRDVDEALRGDVPASVPTLRLLDVAMWMRLSESENARSVRRQRGMPVSARPVSKHDGDDPT
jgi:hypothetical protein